MVALVEQMLKLHVKNRTLTVDGLRLSADGCRLGRGSGA
jgi:hypothetical protein